MANGMAMIDESLWRRDRDFRALPRTAQAMFLQLLAQKDLDCAGVLTLHVDLLAKGCDEMTVDDVWHDLKTLEARRFAYVDPETDELLVRSYARRISATSSDNVRKSLIKAARLLGSPKLRAVLASELRRAGRTELDALANEIEPADIPSGPHPNPITTPSERHTPSEPHSDPPSTDTVVELVSPFVGGSVGEARNRIAEPETSDPDALGDEPPRNCPQHRNDPAPPRCGACGEFNRAHTAWMAECSRVASERARQARLAEIAAKNAGRAVCPFDCESRDGYTEAGVVCNHKQNSTAEGRAAARAIFAERNQPGDDEGPVF